MRLVYDAITRVAESAVNVLVRGESGTGKELVAQAIVASGPRRDKPFVSVNCAALPESLIEAELFGHERAHSRMLTSRAPGILNRPMAELFSG
jgi:Nif-specific regulatory protein